ncbi:hypothetical protein CBR_g51272 [Chara braunii]|uniref:Uncharacterized protein n=1 Tax=Chara braunii TaxID=69332 RepID=A0A388M8A0_CHABU|nr:hypothetical protein CBR_g51272 [Chara braunii]|eukprot:GBG90766.1 hypothetical protein CBR_g51272 [Chara braunii]
MSFSKGRKTTTARPRLFPLFHGRGPQTTGRKTTTAGPRLFSLFRERGPQTTRQKTTTAGPSQAGAANDRAENDDGRAAVDDTTVTQSIVCCVRSKKWQRLKELTLETEAPNFVRTKFSCLPELKPPASVALQQWVVLVRCVHMKKWQRLTMLVLETEAPDFIRTKEHNDRRR